MPRYTALWPGEGGASAELRITADDEADAHEIAEQLGVRRARWSRVDAEHAQLYDPEFQSLSADHEAETREDEELVDADAWRPALD